MKWLIALVALTAAGAVFAATKVVLDNRDPVPGDTVACARRAGIAVARSPDALSVMRPDVLAGRLRTVRRWDWGRTSGVLIQGSLPRAYRVLALWSADTPSLAGDRALTRAFEHPNLFPFVAAEVPAGRELARCALRN